MTRDLQVDVNEVARSLQASTVRVEDPHGRGAGSGVVWQRDGLIVTNAHVVRGRTATVRFADGRHERAELERRDDARDLAALRIGGTPRAAVTSREAATLRPGELVVAVGNPLGLVGALTAGIVQRNNARWVVADVRLAPGNSGGPLADAAGRVVGINSMVAGGLAFAVPSEAVAAFVGDAARAGVGVALAPAMARTPSGALRVFLITGVESGSVAERAGLMLGDAIVGSERGTFDDATPIAATLAAATSLTIIRAGATRDVILQRTDDARAA